MDPMSPGWLEFLPKHSRTALATLVASVALMATGFVARGATVNVGDFNQLTEAVAVNTAGRIENREIINEIRRQTEISTCLSVTERHDADFRVCMIDNTRKAYLLRFAGE